MKIVSRDMRKGIIKVVPETSDDIWVLYLTISPGDLVKAKTFREIKFGEKGSGHSARIPMILTVKVTSLEFQPFTDKLRIRGVIVEGPEKFGLKGKYHTISIGIGSELEITKPQGWPKHVLERIESSSLMPRIMLIAIDYDDYAIGLLEAQGLRILHEDSTHLPGKEDPRRLEEEKGLLTKIAKEVREYLHSYKPIAIVIGGPGFFKNKLAEKLREVISNVQLILDNASMGGSIGLSELVRRDSVKRIAQNLVVIKAQEFFEEFDKRLSHNPLLVAYGLRDVKKAVEQGAVQRILVLDELIHSFDEKLRLDVEYVLRKAEQIRAEILFINALSPPGQKLKLLGGIAALLRFPAYLE